MFKKIFIGTNNKNYKYINWKLNLLLNATHTRKTNRTLFSDPTLDFLIILNRIALIRLLGRIESFLRNKCLVIDDGFIQRGLSLWLRSSPELRVEVVNTYYNTISNNIKCIIVDCGASEALRRVKELRGGLNTSLKYIKNSNIEPNYVKKQYDEMMYVLRKQSLNKSVSIAKLDPSLTKEKQADIVLRELHLSKKENEILLWIF